MSKPKVTPTTQKGKVAPSTPAPVDFQTLAHWNEAVYKSLDQEVKNTLCGVQGVLVLLNQKDEGQPVYLEEAKTILHMVFDSLEGWRQHFEEKWKEMGR